MPRIPAIISNSVFLQDEQKGNHHQIKKKCIAMQTSLLFHHLPRPVKRNEKGEITLLFKSCKGFSSNS